MEENLPIIKESIVYAAIEKLLTVNGGLDMTELCAYVKLRVRKLDVSFTYKTLWRWWRKNPDRMVEHKVDPSDIKTANAILYKTATNDKLAAEYVEGKLSRERMAYKEVPRSEQIMIPISRENLERRRSALSSKIQPLLTNAEKYDLDKLATRFPLDTWVVSYLDRRKQNVMLFAGNTVKHEMMSYYTEQHEGEYEDVRPVRLKSIHLLDRVLVKAKPYRAATQDDKPKKEEEGLKRKAWRTPD